MKALQAKDADGINNTVIENITEKSITLSDKAKTYIDISKYVGGAYYRAINKTNYNNYVKKGLYCHQQCQKKLFGQYHKIKGKYLQNYLKQFVYKLNRRYFKKNLFDSLLIASTFNYGYDNGDTINLNPIN